MATDWHQHQPERGRPRPVPTGDGLYFSMFCFGSMTTEVGGFGESMVNKHNGCLLGVDDHGGSVLRGVSVAMLPNLQNCWKIRPFKSLQKYL